MDQSRADRAGRRLTLRATGVDVLRLDCGALLSRCTFPDAGAPVTCAVSGGADSSALLALAVSAGCEVTAVHVDHRLRPESAAEADVVAALAARLGAGFVSASAPIEPGPNLEARARAARYAVLPADVSTGHTADDQAETVLLNLLRGAGLDGVAAMRAGPRHPLLGLRRAETRELCARMDFTPVEDVTNDDLRIRRNAVRHELLPVLDRLAGRDVAALLARQAQLVRDDVDLLDELAAAVEVQDARALAAAPVPLARRAVRAWLRPVLGGHPPDAAAVERVLAVAAGRAVACEVAGGIAVRRSGGRLRVAAPRA